MTQFVSVVPICVSFSLFRRLFRRLLLRLRLIQVVDEDDDDFRTLLFVGVYVSLPQQTRDCETTTRRLQRRLCVCACLPVRLAVC